MQALSKLIVSLLRDTANRIEEDSCELSPSEAMEILSILSHEAMSKEDACIYLNISRSKFDELIRNNFLPKGRKKRGFKELTWYKDELDFYLREKERKEWK